MDLPRVTSKLVTVEQFPQYMAENSGNGSRGLRDQFLVRVPPPQYTTDLIQWNL